MSKIGKEVKTFEELEKGLKAGWVFGDNESHILWRIKDGVPQTRYPNVADVWEPDRTPWCKSYFSDRVRSKNSRGSNIFYYKKPKKKTTKKPKPQYILLAEGMKIEEGDEHLSDYYMGWEKVNPCVFGAVYNKNQMIIRRRIKKGKD